MGTNRDSHGIGCDVRLPGELFDRMPPAAIEELTSMLVHVNHGANVVLFSEKDEQRGLFVVMEGEVRLSIGSSDGRHLSLRIARKGDIVGLASTLAGAPYDVTAETIYPTKLAHIGRSAFVGFLSRHPETYQAVIEELSRSCSMAWEQLRTVGLAASATEKLARLLLEWSDGRSNAGSSSVRIAMSHEEIGSFIGASRETVTRTLSVFKSRKLVALQGSMLTIPSRAALEHYAQA